MTRSSTSAGIRSPRCRWWPGARRGLILRPRDVFVEQSVARLAQVAVFAGGDAGCLDEGLGAVVATPDRQVAV